MDHQGEVSCENKLSLDVCLAEFNATTNEIQKRLSFQQSLFRVELLAAGLFVSLVLAMYGQIPLADTKNVTSQSENILRIILPLAPILFFSLFFGYISHNIMIISLAKYKEAHIKPMIHKLCNNNKLMSYETFLRTRREQQSKPFGILSSIEYKMLIPLLISAASIALYFVEFASKDWFSEGQISISLLGYFCWAVILSDIILLIYSVYIMHKVHRGYMSIPDGDK